jgi:hypothetical protein
MSIPKRLTSYSTTAYQKFCQSITLCFAAWILLQTLQTFAPFKPSIHTPTATAQPNPMGDGVQQSGRQTSPNVERGTSLNGFPTDLISGGTRSQFFVPFVFFVVNL